MLEPLLQSFHESPPITPITTDTETSTDSVVELDFGCGSETVECHSDAESNTESVQVSTEESREEQVDIGSPEDGNEGSAVYGGVAQQQQRQQEEEEMQESDSPVVWKEKEVRRAAWCLFEVLLPRCVGLEGQSLQTRLQEPTSFSNRCGKCLIDIFVWTNRVIYGIIVLPISCRLLKILTSLGDVINDSTRQGFANGLAVM